MTDSRQARRVQKEPALTTNIEEIAESLPHWRPKHIRIQQIEYLLSIITTLEHELDLCQADDS